jgi:hypothetical protein
MWNIYLNQDGIYNNEIITDHLINSTERSQSLTDPQLIKKFRGL